MQSITVRLSEEMSSRLDALAQRTQRPKSYFVRKALEIYLADEADLQEALDRLSDPTDKIIDEAELRRRLGI